MKLILDFGYRMGERLISALRPFRQSEDVKFILRPLSVG